MPANLTIPATHNSLSQVAQWLATLKKQYKWDRRSLFILQLALEELLVNTIDYGFKPTNNSMASTDAEIDLSVVTSAKEIIVTIKDNGIAFDPTQHSLPPLAPSLEEAEIGGQGLRLIRHYFDEIYYYRCDNHNNLRLKLAR